MLGQGSWGGSTALWWAVVPLAASQLFFLLLFRLLFHACDLSGLRPLAPLISVLVDVDLSWIYIGVSSSKPFMRASKLVTYGIEFTLNGDGADVVYDREVSVDSPRISLDHVLIKP